MAIGLTCGLSGCSTHAVLGVPNNQRRGEDHRLLCGAHVGKVATSHLPSWGSPTPSARTTISNGDVAHIGAKWLYHQCCLGGCQSSARGQQSEIATWSTCGQSGYITPTVLGVSNTRRGDKNPKRLNGPPVGKVATSPLPSSVSPMLRAGTKVRNGYVARMGARWLHHPCNRGGPQRPARGHHPYQPGVRNAQCGDKNTKRLRGSQSGYIAPALLGVSNAQRGDRNVYVAHMWGKWLHHPCPLGALQRSTRGQKAEMAMWHRCGQNGYITPTVLGVRKALARGYKAETATWTTCGQTGYITPAVSGVPNAKRGDENQNCLRGPHVGKLATSALPSWGSPTLSAGEK